MFGLAGNRDAAYSNMAIKTSITTELLNLSRLAVQDILARRDVQAGNAISAGSGITAGADMQAGSDLLGNNVSADGTMDAGGSVSTGEDVKAQDGTVESHSVVATDDGRFVSLYVNGTQVFLNSFPMPLNGTFAYFQSTTVPPAFSGRYIQSYTTFPLDADQSLSFFYDSIPANTYILNFTMLANNAITYIIDGMTYYNPASGRTNPFIIFDHPGGTLSVVFAGRSAVTIPVTAMTLSVYELLSVTPTLNTISLTVPLSYIATSSVTLDYTDFTSVAFTQPTITVVAADDAGSNVIGATVDDLDTPSIYQYSQMTMTANVTRTSGGSGTFYVTFITYFEYLSDPQPFPQLVSVPIPEQDVPQTLTFTMQQHFLNDGSLIGIGGVSVRFSTGEVLYPSDPSYTPVAVNFTINSITGNLILQQISN